MSEVKVKVDVTTRATPTGDDVVCLVRYEGQAVRITFSPSAGLEIEVPEDLNKAASDDDG